MTPLTRAYLLMLLAFFCFASMDTTAKWLVLAAIPALQVAWLRYLGHFICTVVMYMPSSGLAIVRSNRPGLQVLRAIFLLSATALNFTALQYLSLTTTIAIFFAAPLMVCLLSIPVLGESVGIKRLLAVLGGFVGVLIIVAPGSAPFDSHVFLALAAMSCASGYFVMSRLIAGVDGNATVQFYVSGVATVILTPFALIHWVWPDSPLAWVLIMLIGTLGMVGHSVLTHAHKLAEASVLAPTVYSQIIYISVLSWVIFEQTPTSQTLFGAAVIVASGLFLWARERQLQVSQPDSA